MSILDKRTLLINRNYQPILTVTVKKALILLCKGLANVVCPPTKKDEAWQEFTWDDWMALDINENDAVIHSVRRDFKVPEIIKLTTYGGMPYRKTKLSRRAVYHRDDNVCQYCSCEPDYDEITLDHIIPKSRGGGTTWTNVVAACSKCNRIKADRTPKEANMRLLKAPVAPEYDVLQGRRIQCESWQHFL